MKFYGTGTKRKKGSDGSFSDIQVLIPLTEVTRVGAVNQATRIAKREKIRLDGVHLERTNKSERGGILTKNMAKQKASKR